jgi:hypothetical protein
MSKNYWESNPFTKRINGFLIYLSCAFISIFKPEMVDAIMYNTLRQQFENDQHE